MTAKALLLATAVAIAPFSAFAEEVTHSGGSGTITISLDEYEKLKKASEADEDDQYWNMTFQQILDKENGNRTKAWTLYEFYVLRTVHLGGPVSDSSVRTLVENFRVLGEIDAEKPITIIINSPGGSVFAGFNLYNAMMSAPTPFTTICDGMAASMAAVILAVGDHRIANDGCVFLIHEMGGGGPGGQTTDMLKTADWFMTIENVLTQILSENSGLSWADVRRVWEYETFFNADETLALGFVDEVVSDKPRELAEGTRGVPETLLPREHLTRNVRERMGN